MCQSTTFSPKGCTSRSSVVRCAKKIAQIFTLWFIIHPSEIAWNPQEKRFAGFKVFIFFPSFFCHHSRDKKDCQIISVTAIYYFRFPSSWYDRAKTYGRVPDHSPPSTASYLKRYIYMVISPYSRIALLKIHRQPRNLRILRDKKVSEREYRASSFSDMLWSAH